MKAVILIAPGEVENLQLATVDTPVPAAGEVRIRVHAAGFNPSDYKMRRGAPPTVRGPIILGGEVAGVIDAVGADVTELHVGQAVCAYLPLTRGGYAEAVCTHTAFVAPKPEKLSFMQAAAVPLAGLTALACVGTKTARPGSLFIAGGAGGVGSFAIGLARTEAAGPIITTAGSDSSVRYLTQNLGLPLDSIVRYDTMDDDQLCGRIRTVNDEKSFSSALDFVGARMTRLCCELVDFDGCVTSIVQPPASEDLQRLFGKCAAFRFVDLRARARHGETSAWLEYGKGLRRILDLVSLGRVPLPHIEDVGALSAENVRAAHRLLEGRHVHGKLVMSVP